MKIGGGVNYERAYNMKPHEYVAVAGDRIVMDNTNYAVALYLPLAPLDGHWVDVIGAVYYSVNAVVVRGTARNIMVVGDKNCELDIDGVEFRFWWDLSSNLWRVKKINIEGKV